jgi:hypothetical protein
VTKPKDSSFPYAKMGLADVNLLFIYFKSFCCNAETLFSRYL